MIGKLFVVVVVWYFLAAVLLTFLETVGEVFSIMERWWCKRRGGR